MVTKHMIEKEMNIKSLILAKNHMVTKHNVRMKVRRGRLILAKNHMVTKPVEI